MSGYIYKVFFRKSPFRRIPFTCLFFTILIFSACAGNEDQKVETTDQPESPDTVIVLVDTILNKSGFPLVIGPKNWEPSYSKVFFKEYKNSRYKQIEVKENTIILDKRDTALFPETPEIGKRHVLRGVAREIEILLDINRKNYTSIEYELTFSHPRKKTLEVHGTAHLHPDFFIRNDRDQSTTSGATFLVTEFEDLGFKTCPVRIRLGYEEISGSALQAKIERKCNGAFGPVTPQNFPSLIER